MKIQNLILCLCLICQSALAVSVKQSHTVEQELANFFDNYLHNFNNYLNNDNGNQALIASALDMTEPALSIAKSGRLVVLDSREKTQKGTKGFLENLKNEGVTGFRWKTREYAIMSSQSAIASNIAILSTEKGDVYAEVAGTYVLHKTEKGWRIAMRISHVPENRIQLSTQH